MQQDRLLQKFRLSRDKTPAATSYKMIVGAAMVALSGTFVITAHQMPIGTWSSLGTGAYPMVVAWIGVATGMLALVEGLTERGAASRKDVVGAEHSDAATTSPDEPEATGSHSQRLRVWLSFGILAVYFALLSIVGFIVASWLASASFMRLMRGPGIVIPILAGGIVTIVLWLVFEIALAMPLP